MGASVQRSAAERGQAVVEAALGLLVVVTVLVFGIHFAEIGYLSVKVTEAGNYALWDGTSRSAHTYGGSAEGRLDRTPRAAIPGTTVGVTDAAYRDYDGRSAPSETRNTPTQVFTRATPISTECVETDVDTPGPNRFEPRTQLPPSLAGVFSDRAQGGMVCGAEATLAVFGIGRFHDTGGGFFRAGHLAQGRGQYTICSINRAWNGECQGRVMVALGDWSLSNHAAREHAECRLYSCEGSTTENTNYREAVRSVFDYGMGRSYVGAGPALARTVVGAVPYDSATFQFTFRGEESDFVEVLSGEHQGNVQWVVTPGGTAPGPGGYNDPSYYQAYSSQRTRCWLGLPCDWSPR